MNLKSDFSKFVKGIKPSDELAVLYDTDADGICAAVIFTKAMEKMGHQVERFIPSSHANFNVERIRALKEENVNKVIILDFAADQYSDFFTELLKDFEAVLLVDHHKIYKDYNSKNCVFIKAQFIRKDLDGSNYCTAKLVFDLFSYVLDISFLDWLAAIALISDMSGTPWQNFLKKVYTKHNLSKRKCIDLGNIINAGKQVDPPQVERALEVTLEAKKPEDITNSKFSKVARDLNNEIEFWINKFEEKAEKKDDIWLYEIDPSARIGSVVSTVLALKYPNDSIIVIRRHNNWVSINARNHNSKRPVNEFLEKATKGFKGANAGGHIPAAGASIREKDLKEFKKRIWELA
jgi:single-stranded DNA-specific DHH superfamily exonuclease